VETYDRGAKLLDEAARRGRYRGKRSSFEQCADRNLRPDQEASMRHLNSPSHFRHALFALQDSEGYVEALLDMAREQTAARRAPISFRRTPAPSERRNAETRSPAALN
jgi:hypothetical protein